MHAAYIDYWSLAPEDPSGIPVPGHAGAFETSLIRHLHPDIVGSLPPARKPPSYPDVEDVVMHTETLWRTLNGYTDNPTDSGPELGARWFEACVSALGARIVSVAASL
jgi:creatinine amidohydrolase